jgi:hypothetical protein
MKKVGRAEVLTGHSDFEGIEYASSYLPFLKHQLPIQQGSALFSHLTVQSEEGKLKS